LTVAELNPRWAELGSSPILVAHSHCEAYWAQRADFLVAEGGLVVARLWAPWAKTSGPAPGTVWPGSPHPIGDAGGITSPDHAGPDPSPSTNSCKKRAK